jgi:hypothetical protein
LHAQRIDSNGFIYIVIVDATKFCSELKQTQRRIQPDNSRSNINGRNNAKEFGRLGFHKGPPYRVTHHAIGPAHDGLLLLVRGHLSQHARLSSSSLTFFARGLLRPSSSGGSSPPPSHRHVASPLAASPCHHPPMRSPPPPLWSPITNLPKP